MEKTVIKIEELRKVYENGKITLEALKGVDFEVKEREFVAIMGQSGGGKSTMMNILGCLDSLTTGKYYLDDEDVTTLNNKQLSKIRNLKIGFVFQSFNLLPKLSAQQNVELPMNYAGVSAKERTDRAKEALAKVGLEDRGHHKPNELSGGQRQRVAIARALVNNPAIILADEPTGNLDSKAGEEIMRIFQGLNKDGATIVMVTHEPDIAQHTKRIIMFRDGRIIDDKQVSNQIIL